ncbi:hypothetical protein QFZ28_003226 [Neobacillus niacini]|uniref:hypothetical protein n=1 Tax=Neobacillus niacini TaxID=86668 RepID=UPI00277F0BA9|nr:hypothetical protein [Neobacillus niacini]MDQ1002826.1 hypothetical protein [Neobacillus niacini]
MGIRPPLNNDVVGFPIEASQVPTEQSPGFLILLVFKLSIYLEQRQLEMEMTALLKT